MTELSAHLGGRRGRIAGVVLALEQEQQRVSTELEQLTSAFGGDLEHRAEDPAQGVDELLGADASPAGEPLGQGGEPGDVGEAQGAVDHSPRTIGRIEHPLDRQLRHMAVQHAIRP